MFSYNISLAMRSLRERAHLTLLMIAAIAIGLGLLMTVKTMTHQSAKVPLAHKANDIFFIQADNRELTADPIVRQPRMVYLTHRDAQNIMKASTPAKAHASVWKSRVILNSLDKDVRPFRSDMAVTNADFFSMFDVPFLYGSPWNASSDASAEPVIVLTKESNALLFGNNSVGKQLRINGLTVTVVGVIDDWDLPSQFYDESFRRGRNDTAFIPDSLAIKSNIMRNERMRCLPQENALRASFRSSDVQGLINSECSFVRLWAEMDSSGSATKYQDFLEQYVNNQKDLGRFPREMNNYVTSLRDMLVMRNELFGGRDPLIYIAPLFFIVCLLNAISILLAKFTRKAKEVSLRRALGAKKWVLMGQYFTEVCIIGLIGGLLGIGLSYLGLQGMLHIAVYQSDYTVSAESLREAFALDWQMMSMALLIALTSTILVGLYPIWRIINVAPAAQLKSQ